MTVASVYIFVIELTRFIFVSERMCETIWKAQRWLDEGILLPPNQQQVFHLLFAL